MKKLTILTLLVFCSCTVPPAEMPENQLEVDVAKMRAVFIHAINNHAALINRNRDMILAVVADVNDIQLQIDDLYRSDRLMNCSIREEIEQLKRPLRDEFMESQGYEPVPVYPTYKKKEEKVPLIEGFVLDSKTGKIEEAP